MQQRDVVNPDPEIWIEFGEAIDTVSPKQVEEWVRAARENDGGSVCVRFVGLEESKRLNRRFRNIDRATNVLAFEAREPGILGDIAVCVPIAESEAKLQHMPLREHIAHLVVHGTLHLRGFDHLSGKESQVMESKEIQILHMLSIDNPYVDNG